MVQLQVTSVKADNLSRARRLVKEAAGQGSKVVLLPVRRRVSDVEGVAREAGQGALQYGVPIKWVLFYFEGPCRVT